MKNFNSFKAFLFLHNLHNLKSTLCIVFDIYIYISSIKQRRPSSLKPDLLVSGSNILQLFSGEYFLFIFEFHGRSDFWEIHAKDEGY